MTLAALRPVADVSELIRCGVMLYLNFGWSSSATLSLGRSYIDLLGDTVKDGVVVTNDVD